MIRLPEKLGASAIDSGQPKQSLPKEGHQSNTTIRYTPRLTNFYSFLIAAIGTLSPFLGPTLIKHGIPQGPALLVLGFVCGTLLYFVSKQVGALQNRD